MKKLYTSLVVLFLLMTVSMSAVETPINQSCSFPTTIQCGDTFFGNTSQNVISAPSGKRGLWYRYVGTGEEVFFNTCGSDFDTFLFVYVGTCGSLTSITYSDDADVCKSEERRESEVSFVALKNVEYLIFASGFSDNVGNIAISCINPKGCSVSDEATMLSFYLPNQIGATEIDENGVIRINVPLSSFVQDEYGAYSVPLVANFQSSYGSKVYVNGVIQQNGITQNNFISNLVYSVKSGLGNVTKDYLVQVTQVATQITKASSSVSVLHFNYTYEQPNGASYLNTSATAYSINNETREIHVDLPFNAPKKTEFAYNCNIVTNAGSTVLNYYSKSNPYPNQESFFLKKDFNYDNSISILAEDGTRADYRVIFHYQPPSSVPAKFFNYSVQFNNIWVNGFIENNVINLNVPYGTDLSNAFCYLSINIKSKVYLNGLRQVYNPVDYTKEIVYKVVAEDGVTFDVYRVKINVEPAASTSRFVSYAVNGASTVISELDKTILLEVPFGTNLKQIQPRFSLTNQGKAYLNNQLQEANSVVDLSHPIKYNVVAQNGQSVGEWTVSATVAQPSSETAILSYNLPLQYSSTIDGVNKHITVEVPWSFNSKQLRANFTVSSGAYAKLNNVVQVSGQTANDFNSLSTYIVTAQNGSSASMWTVELKRDLPQSEAKLKKIIDLRGELNFVIDEQAGVAFVSSRNSTFPSKLKTSYVTSKMASSLVNGVEQQVNEVELNLDTEPVLTVVSEDGKTSKNYVIRKAAQIATKAVEAKTSDVQIYPNPTNGLVTITFADKQDKVLIQLCNSNGTLVFSHQETLSSSNTVTLNLSTFAKGIYFLKITNAQTQFTEKIIVK